MANPKPSLSSSLNLRTILSESKRIVAAHSRHFLALSVLFLLPISFSTTVYPTLQTLVSDHLSTNSQSFLQISPQKPTTTLILALAVTLFVSVFSLLGLASITYSVFHGFYGRPVKLGSAMNSVLFSFLPLLGTAISSQIVVLMVAFVAGLALFLVVSASEMMGFQMEEYLDSPCFVGFAVVVGICLVLFVVYLEVIWSLAGVVAVVESRWGFDALRRSASLVRGMTRVALSLIVFFGLFTWIAGFYNPVTEYSFHDEWRNLGFVFSIVGKSTLLMIVLLYHAAAKTVLYMYCKAVHGELAVDIADEFATEYVSLPFDDGKLPHVVSVSYT